MHGVTMWREGLSYFQQERLAGELGEQVRILHEMEPTGVANEADWPPVDLVEAAAHSSLPANLVEQVEDYVRDFNFAPADSVIVNGDIVANHVYLDAV
jgi:hygromycin-B 7''-O-kinase